jgi:hypothetical protein
MTLGDRCDEIVRLIDDCLGSCTSSSPVSRLRDKEEEHEELSEPLLRTA